MLFGAVAMYGVYTSHLINHLGIIDLRSKIPVFATVYNNIQ